MKDYEQLYYDTLYKNKQLEKEITKLKEEIYLLKKYSKKGELKDIIFKELIERRIKMSDIQEEQKRLYKRAEENDRKEYHKEYYQKHRESILKAQRKYDKEHKEQKREYDKKRWEEIKRLKEENEKLKELCDKYEEEHKTTFEEWKKDINIIDELEKWIDKNKQYQVISERCIVWEDKLIDKLNELKGDNK